MSNNIPFAFDDEPQNTRLEKPNPGKCFRDKNDLPLPPLETPVEKRDPVKVAKWNYYLENCLFFESHEDFVFRMRASLGADWWWRVDTLNHKPPTE